MRYAIVFMLLFTGCAHFDVGDGAVAIFMATDYLQTKEVLDNPKFEELNPTITEDNVDYYFPVAYLGYWAIKQVLPEHLKDLYTGVWIGVKGANVFHNYRIGVRP